MPVSAFLDHSWYQWLHAELPGSRLEISTQGIYYKVLLGSTPVEGKGGSMTGTERSWFAITVKRGHSWSSETGMMLELSWVRASGQTFIPWHQLVIGDRMSPEGAGPQGRQFSFQPKDPWRGCQLRAVFCCTPFGLGNTSLSMKAHVGATSQHPAHFLCSTKWRDSTPLASKENQEKHWNFSFLLPPPFFTWVKGNKQMEIYSLTSISLPP